MARRRAWTAWAARASGGAWGRRPTDRGRRFSLAPRILAVNVFAILVLTGSIFYLDSFRERLIDQRRVELGLQAELLASFIGDQPPTRIPELAARYGTIAHVRLRVYGHAGGLVADSWQTSGPTFELRDPATEPFRRDIARFLDRTIEAVGSFPHIGDYAEPARDDRDAWAEVRTAALTGRAGDTMRAAPDRIVIISAAAAVAPAGPAPHIVVQVTRDTRDITSLVRAERMSSFLVFLFVLAASLLLSTYLAANIVRPLRMLADAAQRVRLGRSRDVTVPRFRTRRDEIGQLARALSDMTLTLRERIDATEAFAADVAHEIKNPLASLSSAVDTFERVREPRLQAQLLGVIRNDVGRIDRLITDIADASRLDAELSRSRFDYVDLGELTTALVAGYETAGLPRGVEIAFARPESRTAGVFGEAARLAQVVQNLVDNAVSFSPDGGVVVVAVSRVGPRVVLRVDDDGPGIPPDNRDDIFRRFYSERPEAEAFGRHSGLGLAIARTIVEAHDGTITAANRRDGVAEGIGGARFVVSLPAA